MWAAWFRKRRWERGLNTELQFHLDQQVADYVRLGLTEREARERARRDFGGIELTKEECRDERPLLWLDHILRDSRVALRSLRRTPGFTLVCVLVLGLGIGGSTAIFSIIHGVLLKTLPYPEPDRLFALHQTMPKFRLGPMLPVSARHFSEWRKKARSFDGLAIMEPASLILGGDGPPEKLAAARVSAQFFPVLGVRPRLGRVFRADEEPPGHDAVVILSHGLWIRRFQGDPGIIGRQLRFNGEPFEVIGVLGDEVRPALLKNLHQVTREANAPEIFKPLGMRPEDVGAVGDFNFGGVARLKAGISVEQAAAELSLLARSSARTEVPDADVRVMLVPLQDEVGAGTKQSLLLVSAAVGAVLLIVSISVGNLLLARALARLHDLSIRTALGASRPLLVAGMLVETLILALAGGAAGIVLARAGLSLILAHTPVELPRLDDITIDGTVVAFAFGLTVMTALLFGSLPAWRFSRVDPQQGLKSGARTDTAGPRGRRLREILVTAQVAVSMVSLLAAGLLLHSLARLTAVDKGFRTERILTLDVPLTAPAYASDSARATVFRQILEDVRKLPGVQAAGISHKLPLRGEGSNNIISVEGTAVPLLERPVADFRFVDSGYFHTLSIPLRSGRIFREADGERRLTVISAQLAERLWPGESALGKRFHLGDTSSPLHEVIGVAGDVRSGALEKAPPLTAYFPYRHRNRRTMMLAVRTAMDPARVATAVRNTIWKADPQVALGEMKTMAELISAALSARRFQTALVGIFAVIGVVLACIGVYGVAAYAMTQRRAEIGIRMALGATKGNILATGLRHAVLPIGAGLSGGLVISLALGNVLRGLLFRVEPHDPLAMAATAILLAAVTLGACLIPVLRASRVDPALTLRSER